MGTVPVPVYRCAFPADRKLVRVCHRDDDWPAHLPVALHSLVLWHLCAGMYQMVRHLGREELLQDRGLLGFLFRRALGLPPLNDQVPPAPRRRHVGPRQEPPRAVLSAVEQRAALIRRRMLEVARMRR